MLREELENNFSCSLIELHYFQSIPISIVCTFQPALSVLHIFQAATTRLLLLFLQYSKQLQQKGLLIKN